VRELDAGSWELDAGSGKSEVRSSDLEDGRLKSGVVYDT